MVKYDLAVSFAGEQRALAESFARRLDAAGYSIFYDRFEAAELWGRDLSLSLEQAYAEDARYCLILVSQAYLEKAWTNLERQNALARFMRERRDYVLCLRVENVKLPGLPDVVAYIDHRQFDENAVYKLLLEKLGPPNHADRISRLSGNDREIAKLILAACYRRAIYTRMDSEIDLDAMYRSIGEVIGRVQSLTPSITDPALQFAALEILGALDGIERVRTLSSAQWSNHLEPRWVNTVDEAKREVVRLLLEVRRAGDVPIQLPFALRLDHFYGLEAANDPPPVAVHD